MVYEKCEHTICSLNLLKPSSIYPAFNAMEYTKLCHQKFY